MYTKKRVLILIVYHFIIATYFTNSYSQTNNYSSYYSAISKAELAILDSNYTESYFFYKKAFKTVSSGFAKDYFNAAICAAYAQDKNGVVSCFSQLALKGVSLAYLKEHLAWKYLKNDTILAFFEKRIFEQCRKKYLSEKNLLLKDKLLNIFHIDQDIILKKYPDAPKRHFNNIQTLDSLINIYGFPSEDIIGVGDSLETSPSFLNILYNDYAKYYEDNKFFNIVKMAAIDGKLHPSLTAFYMSSLKPVFELEATAVYKVSIDSSQVNDLNIKAKINKWVFPIYSESHLLKINNNRKEIGWEDFLSYQKKVIFNLKYPKFIFSLSGGASIYICNQEYIAERYLANVDIIEGVK